nr:PREDICTED: putative fatty acyl-CoA reductase CG5065 [Bemisia tabaci]
MDSGSRIANFFDGRHILITGATGFIGKVLVEKLLRSCPKLSKIYLLMRPKKGVDIQTRLKNLLDTEIFEYLRQTQNEQLQKLVAVNGDITSLELGLSAADQKLLSENVSVVFHSAATVKFDEDLKPAVIMNLQGTKQLLQLCRKMSQLEALVHVSTAYCNCDQKNVLESVYPPPADPDRIIEAVSWMDNKLLDALTPVVIDGRPNTYTFTKALAEHVLVQENGKLPIAIIRPSIVTASWREPIPGWVDNLNGPTGLLAGAGKGVLRSVLCHRNKVGDLIPVDIVVNLMITVAWSTATENSKTIKVYNCTSGSTNPIKWGELENWGRDSVLSHPFTNVVWYPGGSFKYTRFMNNISVILFHAIPAYLIDFSASLLGRKPVMVRLYHRLQRAVGCLEFFTTHEWKFSNENVQQLWSILDQEDKEHFDFDVAPLQWRKYIDIYVRGTQRFLLKEDVKDQPEAKRHLRKMYYVHRFTQLVLAFIAWKMFARIYGINLGLYSNFMDLISRLLIIFNQKFNHLFR